jgi:hypothetical protein
MTPDSYNKTAGRLRVTVNRDGMLNHDYGHGCTIECPTGWNDSCPIVKHTVCVEELRDLRHLLDRAIAHADAYRESWNRHLIKSGVTV